LHSVQPQDDGQSCGSEWRGSVELLPQVKEEPKVRNIQTREGRDSEEGNCSHMEPLQSPRPPPVKAVCRSASPPPLTSQEIKAESGRADDRRQQPAMSAHILQIKNSMQRWHSCKECGKGFSFACQLEVHMRWHTKEKPYSCAVCRKSFTTVSMLKRHHRIHTGEKPFRCHVCGKCFNQSAHLNTHFRLHTRERPGWSVNGCLSQCDGPVTDWSNVQMSPSSHIASWDLAQGLCKQEI
uniref:Zinc finger protein 79-like n=1 Tax=Echeneis naucrates TaxID=173247 RepID=A0A665T9R9_ECHNA